MNALLDSVGRWMGHSWLGDLAREQFWLFPAAEIVHFFGLCLLFGAVLVIDLRMLGFTRAVSMKRVLSFVPVATTGLVLNTVSGIVFLCAYPENYFPSTAFRLKLLAIAAGGLNALWFQWAEVPHIDALADDADASLRVKVAAIMSLTVWVVVIVLGRFLPYVSTSTS